MFDPSIIEVLNSIPAPILFFVTVWNLIWKGIALWHAGRNEQKYWFVALLITNSLGILEIVYILFFRKKASKNK